MKRVLNAIVSLLCLSAAAAFAPSRAFCSHPSVAPLSTASINPNQPPALQRQRKSMAPVQTMSLFGLGGPELAVILIAGAFLLGPQKLAELGKDAGKIAGELKEVPKEFQKGLEEGEAEALQMKKKMIDEAEKKSE